VYIYIVENEWIRKLEKEMKMQNVQRGLICCVWVGKVKGKMGTCIIE